MPIQFQYSTTTVDMSACIIAQNDQYSDANTQKFMSATKKTVVTYEIAPLKKILPLQIKTNKTKLTELQSFWNLINGAEKTFVYTDKDSVTHNVKWIDEVFSLSQTGVNTAEGTISLEVV